MYVNYPIFRSGHYVLALNNLRPTHTIVHTDEEELVALKKQNLELKYQNGQVLNHLQDGRQVHIEREVEALMAVIPQRSASMVYKCQSHNDALKQCYQTHLNAQKTAKLPEGHVIQLDLLKCRPFVSEFVECAQGTRREFLANNDL